jgi:hypothetical protein
LKIEWDYSENGKISFGSLERVEKVGIGVIVLLVRPQEAAGGTRFDKEVGREGVMSQQDRRTEVQFQRGSKR